MRSRPSRQCSLAAFLNGLPVVAAIWCGCLSTPAQAQQAQDRAMDTGWYWPTGSSERTVGWLAPTAITDCVYCRCTTGTAANLGQDLQSPAGHSGIVVSLADGEVIASSTRAYHQTSYFSHVGICYTSEWYDEFWMGETRVSDPGVGKVRTRSLSAWVAYGLTDRLTVIGSIPFVDADSDGAGGFGDSGLQDLTFLGAYRIVEGGEGARHSLVGAA